MAVLTNMRRADVCPPSGLHPYIDTPDFSYDQWLVHLKDAPIGTIDGSPTVAIVGGGVSGLCAAYELQRAGCIVTVFEQAHQVGGRCASYRFPAETSDIAELGSMRFPPTEFILDFYLRKLGIVPCGLCSLPDFPDPGKQPTFFCYGGRVEAGNPGSKLPDFLLTVKTGWDAFITDGLSDRTTGVVLLQPASAITRALVMGDVGGATAFWQAYLDAFGQKSFFEFLYEVFTGSGKYRIPGKTEWKFADFDRFGALGIGSGGFGSLYSVGFMDIFRLIVNELETTQKFLQPSANLQDGIRTLPLAFANIIGSPHSNPPTGVVTETAINSIYGTFDTGFHLNGSSGGTKFCAFGPYDRVIVATTTRAMELSLNLTKYGTKYGTPALLSPAVARAIMRTHVASSNKVAARIIDFWTHSTKPAIRCLQTDTLAQQVYTLDYTAINKSSDGTGVCFISYVWDDDAIKQQALTSGRPNGVADNEFMYTHLLKSIHDLGGAVSEWAENLKPIGGDFTNNVMFEEWQSTPFFAGAFKLSQPGQDQHVANMFFDYQKCCVPSSDTGVYVAGDCVAWTSGWIEGGLTTALNAAAAVIHSLGGKLNADSANKTPLSVLSNRYKYF